MIKKTKGLRIRDFDYLLHISEQRFLPGQLGKLMNFPSPFEIYICSAQ